MQNGSGYAFCQRHSFSRNKNEGYLVRRAGGLPGRGDPEYDSILRVFEGWWRRWHDARFRNADGNLNVEYLYWNDSRWNWNYNWLDNDWNDNEPAASLANLIVLPHHFPDHRVLRTTTKRRALKRVAVDPKAERVVSYLGMMKHGNARKIKDRISALIPDDGVIESQSHG